MVLFLPAQNLISILSLCLIFYILSLVAEELSPNNGKIKLTAKLRKGGGGRVEIEIEFILISQNFLRFVT